MDQWTIYYNPRCGSCQKALKILKEKGIKPTVVEYLKNPLSIKNLNLLLRKLRVSPMEIIRSKEPMFEKLKLGEGEKSREDLLRAVSENPVLLQRPIVVSDNGRAVIARPPENVLALFE
ncbi:MAG: arsenate reductase (glutaredoxin) [Elusimicrobiota bacterium]